MIFLKELDIVIWGEKKRRGCDDGYYVNIPIYVLQNLLLKEIRNYNNVKILFDSLIESVSCVDNNSNCRIIITQNCKDTCNLYGVLPRLVVIADGKHDDRGISKTLFGFPSASKVHLSSYGIIGMIDRTSSDNRGPSICLKNYNTNHYRSKLISRFG